MEQVVFVILHYMALDVTINCVESILSKMKYENYKIVIVDNASSNASGKHLNAHYQSNPKVKVLLNGKNSGFSAGNNIGYRYAKDKYNADFIIVMNNDTEIIQEDFADRAISIYYENHYYVLGPDIINKEGIHQSPQRDHIITKKEARIWYYKRILFSVYLHLHRKINLTEDSYFYKLYLGNDKKRIQGYAYDKKCVYVEPQGSCFVFSPLYIKQNEIAFEELTFMYCEEALLTRRCWNNRWKLLYDPSIKILHLEQAATKLTNRITIEKEIFYSDNYVKALGALLRNL